jgi:hypothetical protein
MKRADTHDMLLAVPSIAGPLFDEGPFAKSTVEPSPCERIVAEAIYHCRGRHNPVPIAHLSEVIEREARTVKGIVEDLRVKHRLPIGACRQEPYGYYWIVDAADQAAAVEPYRNQILSMWRTLAILDSKPALRELLGQLRIDD